MFFPGACGPTLPQGHFRRDTAAGTGSDKTRRESEDMENDPPVFCFIFFGQKGVYKLAKLRMNLRRSVREIERRRGERERTDMENGPPVFCVIFFGKKGVYKLAKLRMNLRGSVREIERRRGERTGHGEWSPSVLGYLLWEEGRVQISRSSG